MLVILDLLPFCTNFNISLSIPTKQFIAILLGIDQLLDMGRTTVNLIGNCIATVVIAKWENEFDYNKMNNYIASKAEKLESKPYKYDIEN